MQLKSNLAVLMADRKIKTVKQLQDMSGLSRNAINRAMDDTDESITGTSLNTLIVLCDTLECTLDELIQYK